MKPVRNIPMQTEHEKQTVLITILFSTFVVAFADPIAKVLSNNPNASYEVGLGFWIYITVIIIFAMLIHTTD